MIALQSPPALALIFLLLSLIMYLMVLTQAKGETPLGCLLLAIALSGSVAYYFSGLLRVFDIFSEQGFLAGVLVFLGFSTANVVWAGVPSFFIVAGMSVAQWNGDEERFISAAWDTRLRS